LGFEHRAAVMAEVDADRVKLIFDLIEETQQYFYESSEKLARLVAELPAER
jgi:hypothetical protein